MKWLYKIREFLATALLVFVLDMAFGAVTYFLVKGVTTLFDSQSGGDSMSLADLLIGNGSEALLATTVIYVIRTFDKRLRPKWLVYVLLAVMVFVAEQVIFESIYAQDFWRSLWTIHPLTLIFGSNIMAASCLTYYFMQYERNRMQKITEQEYQLLQLKELKTKAELEALQAKISPHFLYNALNSIASLVHENPDKAEQMVLLLAKFFRYSTNAKSQYLTSLADEIEMVKTYLEVEKVRFGERLEYSVWFENEELRNCLVPQFLLQPLAENAIKHGISKSMDKGILGIEVLDKGQKLTIVIFDNGVPFPEQLITGYGLRSTQDKLRLLMGEDAKMEIINGRNPNRQATANQPHKAVEITVRKQVSADFTQQPKTYPKPLAQPS